MIFLKNNIILICIVFLPTISFGYSANDNWEGEPSSGARYIKSVKGKNFAISTADSYASKAAAEILKKGGNAIDAAITAQLVLNVVEPHSSGIGGGGFLLYYNSKNKTTEFFNGREKAPARAYEKMFLNIAGKPRKFQEVVKGGLSVGTPGLLMILKQAHDKYGKLPWQHLFAPAIKIAEQGFAIDNRTNILANKISYLKNFKQSYKLYYEGDKAKPVGTIVKNQELAKSFKIIAKKGIEPFYDGKIGQDIVKKVRFSKINPGLLSINDLKNYKSKTGNLVCSKYRQYKVCSMPPPSSGGITLLQILSILENFNLKSYSVNSAEFIHLFSEASKLAYADRNEYLADVSDVPIKQMLNKEYLKNRAYQIDKNQANNKFKPGIFDRNKTLAKKNLSFDQNAHEPLSTTHISIIDQDKNSVALTSSIEYFFGSGISVRGFMLNNQMTDFSFKPEINGKKVANRVQPGKMPRSSMTPTFVFDSKGNLIMSIGSPGGPRIIQFLAKAIILSLDFNLNIQQAISYPNFIALNNEVELEAGTDIIKNKSKLEELGHQVTIKDIVSGINGIKAFKSHMQSGADPRRQGSAISN